MNYKDKISGVSVECLTPDLGFCHHLYFTNPGWFCDNRKIVFAADRGQGYNLYKIDLSDGKIEQLTDLEGGTSFLSCSVNPCRSEAYFFYQSAIYAIDLEQKKLRKLYTLEPDWKVHMTNVSADGEKLYYATFLPPVKDRELTLHETFRLRPQSHIREIDLTNGKTRIVADGKGEQWIAHCNTSPTQPHLLSFCHEGPWNEIDHRIWMLNVESGECWPIRPTTDGEVVGHEYWYADGERIGYHGHINDSKHLGRINYDNTGKYDALFPGFTGHIFSHDENLIVGDGCGKIQMWKWLGDHYSEPRVLCCHDSAMNIQETHPHPRISPDGKYIIFSSDREDGIGRVYRVEIADFDTLPKVQEQQVS